MQPFQSQEYIDQFGPKIFDKLADSKIAIRQQTQKIIIMHHKSHKSTIWMDYVLKQLLTRNQHIKEEILMIIIQLYQDDSEINYSHEKILREVSPLIEDQKTKIQLKCVECMIVISLKTGVEKCKSYLKTIMEEVYYKLYLEKLNQRMQLQQADKTCTNILDSDCQSRLQQQTSFYTDQGNMFQQQYPDISFNVVNSEASFQLNSPPKITSS